MTASDLVVERVVLVFFPAVAVLALELVRTAIFIVHEEGLALPEGTLLGTVGVVLRRPSEVLPVVAVVATRLVMFKLIKWTEHCFEVEQVEVPVFFQ